MKIYKFTLFENSDYKINPIPVLTEHYKTKESAMKKKSETLEGLRALRALLGKAGKYEVEITEIEVKD